MERAERIIERLPQFYKAWDKQSVFFILLKSISKELDEQQKQMFTTLRSHWIDTAYSNDLDLLASLFRIKRKKNETDENFRRRIKLFIPEFTGGGTRESIIAQTKVYLNMTDRSPILIENPPRKQIRGKRTKYGDIWFIRSTSITDEKPIIRLTVDGKGYQINNPTITDIDDESSITFNGIIQSGKTLTIEGDGKATYDGIDVSNLVLDKGLKIKRKGSRMKFTESLTPRMGRFDETKFDEHIFEIFVPSTVIELEWNAKLLSSFELIVPASALSQSGVSKDELEELINSLKASGVKAFLIITDDGIEEDTNNNMY